jgi:uncharacterized membrane protein YdjX (TVP38/TMEM64 family)
MIGLDRRERWGFRSLTWVVTSAEPKGLLSGPARTEIGMAKKQHDLPHGAARPPPPARRHGQARHESLHHRLLFGLAKNKPAIRVFVLGLALVLAGILSIVLFTDLSLETLTAAIERLNPVAVLPAMAVLPVIGFPISVVYLVAGARFGPLLGGGVVAIVTAAHLLLTHAITKTFLRKPLERVLERRHLHFPEIPHDEHALVALIVALVPGLPYVLRNYVLALSGVRLKIYFWVCLPIYVARSYVTILLGDMGADPTGQKLIILGVIEVVKFGACAFVIWRLREHHRKFHPADDHGPGGGVVAPPSAPA